MHTHVSLRGTEKATANKMSKAAIAATLKINTATPHVVLRELNPN